jgi:hypothetical protein
LANPNGTAKAIQEMVRFFLPRCDEPSTLLELDAMVLDREQWKFAHALFGRIRDKNLCAIKTKDRLLQHQYAFEEICAKTLYNISGHIRGKEFPPLFDSDCPFWVLPIAVAFARFLGVDDPISVSPLLRPAADLSD